jgi:Ca2+-binding RTX toxin-like protein
MIGRFWTCLRNTLSSRLPRSYQRRRPRYAANLRAEHLEQRQLLAVSPITFSTTTSAIMIDGTAEADYAQVWNDATYVHVSLTTGTATTLASFEKSRVGLVKFTAGDGDDRLDNLTDIATVSWGGNGNDTLIAGSGNDRLYGGAGDDTLYGGAGDDQLYGEDGSDILFGQSGADRLEGAAGNDRLEGGAENDRIFGGIGNDDLYGDDGQDRLWGDAGADKLTGGAGNDLLYGGTEADTMLGGDGNDELYGEDGNDRIWGQSGADRLEGGTGSDYLYGGVEDDTLKGGDGNDRLYGENGIDRLWGQNGLDLLDGGAGNDQFYGGADADSIYGGDGDDELNGEDGNDFLSGDSGLDRLYGNAGDDQLDGGADDDSLFGADGLDVLYGNDGNDRLSGENGADILIGGNGIDQLYGGADDDLLVGSAGDDQLYGDLGNDLLWGEAGSDALEGGVGHDVLVGGLGDDRLVGDFGNDVLIGGADLDSLYGQEGEDLLIGATTAYDYDFVKLRALALAWSAASPYAARVEQIEDDAFAAHLSSNGTVFDDGIADAIFGGDSQDWFFQTGFQGVYVPADVQRQQQPSSAKSASDHVHVGPVTLDHPPELEGFELISALDAFNDRQSDEAIHSILPHAGTAVLQREHLSLFQLVRYDDVTHYAVRDGAWSDPATWHDGVVPVAGAHVLIPLGVKVRVDAVMPARLSTIRVDGTLSFDSTRNTELRVDTMVVFDSGTFEMGTAAAPIMPGVTARLVIVDNGAIDRLADPFAIGRGLISHGKLSIYGAQVSSYAALAGPVSAGAMVLSLKQAPVGWKLGDQLVIAATTPGTLQNEVRTIAGISGDFVVLDRPLSYSHVSPSPDYEVHVANVTRNAVIESEASAADRRGHVMFMHNANVNVAYAGFYRLGRTNKMQPINDPVVNDDWSLQAGTGTNPRARYAVHFHRAGQSRSVSPALVLGSAVVDSPGWGFVNHSSHVDMIKNVAFDVHGAAFTTEVGDEIGSFRGNFALGSTGSGEAINSRITVQDFGHQGDGFWFQGGGTFVTDNISAGNDGHAFAYYTRGLIESDGTGMFRAENLLDSSIANGAAEIDVGQVPIFQFERNIGYASATGLAVRYQLLNPTHTQKSVLQDSILWNNTTGVNLAYSTQIVLRDMTVAYTPGVWPAVGIQENSLTRDVTYDNLTVTGYDWGIDVARAGYSIINGGFYDNRDDIVVQTAVGAERYVLITGAIQFGSYTIIGRHHLRMRSNFDWLAGEYSGGLFLPDVVLLNYGPFVNQRAYYPNQLADVVAFPVPQAGLPIQYVGLTNQQLWDQYGVAVGGAVAPPDAYTVWNILGYLGPGPVI